MLVILAVLFFGLRYVLVHFTDSGFPGVDAFTTALYVIGMWLMARKKLENWIAWIIGDIIAIPLYTASGLLFSGFQYLVFLIIAILGYIGWRRKLLLKESE
jgi:nicotinamide mononucleotide transporter